MTKLSQLKVPKDWEKQRDDNKRILSRDTPDAILTAKLPRDETSIFIIVFSFNNHNLKCWLTNYQFGRILKIKPSRASHYINDLIKKNWIMAGTKAVMKDDGIKQRRAIVAVNRPRCREYSDRIRAIREKYSFQSSLYSSSSQNKDDSYRHNGIGQNRQSNRTTRPTASRFSSKQSDDSSSDFDEKRKVNVRRVYASATPSTTPCSSSLSLGSPQNKATENDDDDEDLSRFCESDESSQSAQSDKASSSSQVSSQMKHGKASGSAYSPVSSGGSFSKDKSFSNQDKGKRNSSAGEALHAKMNINQVCKALDADPRFSNLYENECGIYGLTPNEALGKWLRKVAWKGYRRMVNTPGTGLNTGRIIKYVMVCMDNKYGKALAK